MGGRTSRSDLTTTQQIDARQLDQSARQFEDNSEGNINAGGNVTIESVAAAQAATQAAERIAEENQRAIEEANETARIQAEEQRRIAEEREATRRHEAEENRRILEAANETAQRNTEVISRLQEELARQTTQQSQFFTQSNTTVSTASIEATARAAETAAREVAETATNAINSNTAVISDALDNNERNFEETLEFLQADDASDKVLFSENFNFLNNTIKDANDLSQASLTEAFKSTIGGITDQQNKTLIIGLAVVATVAAVAVWRATR